MCSLYDVLESRKMRVSIEPNGHSFPYHLERIGHASAFADRASAARLAARQVFWWRAISGPEAHHAHAGSTHRLREREMPEHWRVLGTRDGDVHDSGRPLHAGLRILRCYL